MQSLIGRLALPGLTGKMAEDSIKYNTGRLLNVPRIARGKEWAQVGRELEVLNFRFQVFLKSGAGYWIAGMGHVLKKCIDNLLGIRSWIRKGGCQIEKVPTFFPLKERSQFCRENLIEFIGPDPTGAAKPTRFDRVRNLGGAVDFKVLASVDFNLQTERNGRRVLGLKPIREGDAALCLLPLRSS